MSKRKHICLLGSTGSIGQNSLEVIANFPDKFYPACLSTNKNIDILLRQIKQFHPKAVCVLDHRAASQLKQSAGTTVEVYAGEEGLIELARRDDIDIVINALVGFAGLKPTIEAIKKGKTIALANKETLVVAGEIITRLVKESNARLVPIDSEHSAILQCLSGEQQNDISRLILTASGGPFLHLDKKEFPSITVEAALKHPNWKMGNKITIDSATMMNKGLEIIEAHWLFGLPSEKIEVLVHPQSIIHSMVEFVDGSIKAQLGVPDMKIPIQYALTYPDRAASVYKRVDFHELRAMTFLKPDREKFECLQLAYDALEAGGTAPAVLNAANEKAVELFLGGNITFDMIPTLVRKVLKRVRIKDSPSLNDIIASDAAARTAVHEITTASPITVPA